MLGRGESLAKLCEHHEGAVLTAGAVLAVLLRCALSVSPYSGEGKPPMYGDFEAQRHWMEITTALPAVQWYRNSTDNDLLYWGLDYPPLTAYHSFVLGRAGRLLVPDCFALHSSRGHETAACRRFMRASVVLSDLAAYLPGALWAVRGLAAERERPVVCVASILALWCLPPLLLVDHGHFQYNGVCFGLCLAAAGCVAQGRTLLASVLFTSGLLFKQIALYYAPAFFVTILAHCLRRSTGVASAVGHVAVTGCVVLGTAGAVFAPWLATATPLASALQVLHRMFPFARGLYEDKVANVWCSISVVIKLHRLLPPRRLPLFCASVTLLALIPACACSLRLRQSGKGSLAASLTASAFAFFLFAFQVHEKSILFPCVAACLLPVAMGPARRPRWLPAALCHFVLVCMFSMYPLVVKDRLQGAYIALCSPLVILCEVLPALPAIRAMFRASYVLAVAIHGVHAILPPPAKYPDMWTLMITSSSCAYFTWCLAGVSVVQLYGRFDGGLQPRKDD